MEGKLIYGKFSNVENPGRDFDVNVNGEHFKIEDGKEGWYPEAVVEVVKHAVVVDYKFQGVNQLPKQVLKPRFVFTQLTPPEEQEKITNDFEEELESKTVRRRSFRGAE